MRGPPPGTPKHPGSGRQKGTPNHVTLQTREALWASIARLTAQGQDANPFHVLLQLMLHATDDHIRVACAVALADRLLPKLKAVELTGTVAHEHSGTVALSWAEHLTRAQEALAARRNGPAPHDAATP